MNFYFENHTVRDEKILTKSLIRAVEG